MNCETCDFMRQAIDYDGEPVPHCLIGRLPLGCDKPVRRYHYWVRDARSADADMESVIAESLEAATELAKQRCVGTRWKFLNMDNEGEIK